MTIRLGSWLRFAITLGAIACGAPGVQPPETSPLAPRPGPADPTVPIRLPSKPRTIFPLRAPRDAGAPAIPHAGNGAMSHAVALGATPDAGADFDAGLEQPPDAPRMDANPTMPMPTPAIDAAVP